MLKSWIENIRSERKDYGSHYWKYQLSANFLEISVLPPYQKNRELYRCAVIHIGRALQALTNLMEKKRVQYLIQTFPNLEDSKLVATIRVNPKKNGSSSFPVEELTQASSDTEDIFELMEKKAQIHQLQLEEVLSDISSLLPAGSQNPELRSFVITTNLDNPFTWLKTGYWIEVIHQTLNVKPDTFPPLVTHFCSEKSNLEELTQELNNKKFIQALISVKA